MPSTLKRQMGDTRWWISVSGSILPNLFGDKPRQNTPQGPRKKQTNKQTNKQTHKQTNKHTNKQTNKQTNRRASKQASKQTNKQDGTNSIVGTRHQLQLAGGRVSLINHHCPLVFLYGDGKSVVFGLWRISHSCFARKNKIKKWYCQLPCLQQFWRVQTALSHSITSPHKPSLRILASWERAVADDRVHMWVISPGRTGSHEHASGARATSNHNLHNLPWKILPSAVLRGQFFPGTPILSHCLSL